MLSELTSRPYCTAALIERSCLPSGRESLLTNRRGNAPAVMTDRKLTVHWALFQELADPERSLATAQAGLDRDDGC